MKKFEEFIKENEGGGGVASASAASTSGMGGVVSAQPSSNAGQTISPGFELTYFIICLLISIIFLDGLS